MKRAIMVELFDINVQIQDDASNDCEGFMFDSPEAFSVNGRDLAGLAQVFGINVAPEDGIRLDDSTLRRTPIRDFELRVERGAPGKHDAYTGVYVAQRIEAQTDGGLLTMRLTWGNDVDTVTYNGAFAVWWSDDD